MRIDGIINQQYSAMETKTEKASGSVSAAFMADAVSFGSSEDSIFGGSGEKTSFLSAGDGSMESLKQQAEILKDNLSAIFNKMDTGAAVQMDEDGIDINNTDAEKIVTVVEQIQIKLAMYCEDFEASVDIDAEAVKQVIGDGAAAFKIAGELKKNGIKPTKDNVSELMGALEMAERIGSIDDGMKAYLMQNNMAPTVGNVYISANAGYVNKSGVISDSEWRELSVQAQKILREAGRDATDENLTRVRWMLDNDIQVTAESFERLEALDEAEGLLGTEELIDRIAASMTEGKAAKDALISGKPLPWEEAVTAVRTVEKAADGAVAALAASEGEYTLEALAEIIVKGETAEPDKNDYKYVKASRELQEIRLMMTLEAAWTMERNGISVNTSDISVLVDELKKYELNIFNLNREQGDGEVTLMEVEQVGMAMSAIDSLRFVPSAVIGSVVEAKEEPTVNALTYHAPAVTAKAEAAGNAYEALSTEVRSDLGDSVSKAIKASTGDILSGMGYEDSEANRRAVRILAYNGMEISRRNVDRVKSIDYSVNELFKNMTPQRVLNMIREGYNPLETNVEELNAYFINMSENIRPEAEKYSEFLYRMEKSGEITKEEREKFVGIYSLISRFQKDGMRAAGALMSQRLELTMGNLLTAYMSRKDRNMDLTADDTVYSAEHKDKVTYYKNLLGGISGRLTPEAFESMEGLDEMTPEQFAQAVRESETARDDAVYAKYTETARDAAKLADEVLKLITYNEIPATYNNLMAAQAVSSNAGDIFDEYKKRTGDEEAEERLLEALESRDSAQSEYDSLMEQARRLVGDAVGTVDSYIDMETMRLLGNNMELIGTLARKNNYQIPYETGDGTGIINLKIIETGENTGSFVIKMTDERFGELTVEAKADSQSVRAQIMCTNPEGEELLGVKSREISEALKQRGVKEVRISVSRTKAQPDGKSAVKEGVSTEALFGAAKIFVKGLAN
ncbi:MAG: DUF6240 domain-containing protein [Butyrivibrio sp.]|nr:DUF6240 domain-containing protein [Butyrivibrio sp.]